MYTRFMYIGKLSTVFSSSSSCFFSLGSDFVHTEFILSIFTFGQRCALEVAKKKRKKTIIILDENHRSIRFTAACMEQDRGKQSEHTIEKFVAKRTNEQEKKSKIVRCRFISTSEKIMYI